MPVIDAFVLSYPCPEPLQSSALPPPFVGPGLLPPTLAVVVGEAKPPPPHPAMIRSWSANTNEQSSDKKSRNMGYADVMTPGRPVLSQVDGNVPMEDRSQSPPPAAREHQRALGKRQLSRLARLICRHGEC